MAMKHISYSIYNVFEGGTFSFALASLYLLITCIARILLNRIKIHITRRMIFLLISCIHGVLTVNFPDYLEQLKLHPKVVELLFLPICILHTTYGIDLYYMKKYACEITLITLVGIITFTVLNLSMLLNFGSYGYIWTFGLIYIVLISSIGTIENVRRYKEFEYMRVGIVILEGEFIFGMCICFTTVSIFDSVILLDITSWAAIVKIIILKLLGALIIGFTIGGTLSFLIMRRHGDLYSIVCGVLVVIYFTYFISINYFNMSGVIPVFIISLLLSLRRSHLSVEIDEALEKNWEILHYFIEYTAYLLIITECITFIYVHMAELTYFKHISVFFMGELSRLLLLSLLYPVITRTGNLQLCDFMVIYWYARRGLMQLMLAAIILDHYPEDKANWLSIIIVYIIIHEVILNLFGDTLLKLFKLRRHSLEKEINFLNCVNFLENNKRIFLIRLKRNRYLGDCKWSWINQYTELSRYKASQTIVNDNILSDWKVRTSVCENCSKEITLMPTKKEQYQMMVEAKLIALSALKMSAVQQHEKCFITKDTFRKILQSLEHNSKKPDEALDISDIIAIFRTRGTVDKIRDVFVALQQRDDMLPPRKRSRRIVYYIVTSGLYEVIIYIIVVLSAIDYYVNSGQSKYVQVPFDFAFCLVFMVDCFLKIYAYSFIYIRDGIKRYLSYKWNIFEVTLLAFNVILLFFHLIHFSDKLMNDLFLAILWSILNLRLLKIIAVIYKFKAQIVWLCNKIIGRRMAIAYSVGLSLLICYKETLHALPILVTRNDICQNIVQEVEKKMFKIVVELFWLQNIMPNIALTVKTRQIASVTLCNMKECVQQLKGAGMMDEYEHIYLMESITVNCKAVLSIRNLSISTPQLLLSEQSWLEGIENVGTIFENSIIVKWERGETVLGKGIHAPGIYILIEGFLEQQYIPEGNILEHIREYGMLPVRDCIMNTKFWNKSTKYILPGYSIGFLSVLTGRPYEAIITSSSKSRAYFIPKDVILDHLADESSGTSHGLFNNIWKFISIEMVISIIWRKPQYCIFTDEVLYFHMRKAYVPNLRDETFFIKTEVIDDIILLEGMVNEVYQDITFIAPCYLPRTINKLKLITTWTRPVLMVMPLRDQQVQKQKPVIMGANYSSSRLLRSLPKPVK